MTNIKWMVLAIIICLAVIEINSFRIYRRPSVVGIRGGRRYLHPIGRPIGLGYEGLHSGSNYARGRTYNNRIHDSGANGAEGKEFHNSGRREFHNTGHHHNKVTKVTTADNSESHDVGGSESFNHGGAFGKKYNNYDRDAKQLGNDFNQGQQFSSSF